MNSITDKITARIRRRKPGWVFTPKDFLDVGTRAAVDQVLSRLTRQGMIRRIDRGIYYYPKVSKLLGPLSPTPDNIARALAPGAYIFCSGAMATNLLGLSTQVPAKASYLTNTTVRTRRVAGQNIEIKKARIPLFDDMPDHINLLVQALSYLGKDNIDDEIVSRSARILRKKDSIYLRRVIKRVPGWMAGVIYKIENVKREQLHG